LAKNVTHSQKDPNDGQIVIKSSESLFVEGIYNKLEKKWIEFTICEFMGITKTRLVTLMEKEMTNLEGDQKPIPLLEQLETVLEKYRKIYNIKKVYGGYFLCQQLDITKYDITPLFSKEIEWQDFVEKMFLGKKEDEIKLDWTCSSHCLALTICSLVLSTEYLLLD
jgi:hypothetical protein